MEINKFKKIGKNKYKVCFNNGELILYEDIILKYNLLVEKSITLELIDEITKENTYYEAFALALNYIGIKMRYKKEIIKYLEKKDFSKSIIESTIDRLIEMGLIDDIKYIEAYVNDKIYLSSYGPFKIKNDLIQYDFDEDLIDNYISNIDNEIWLEKLLKLVNKKIKLSKNKSIYMLQTKLRNDLFYLGYDKNMIESIISQISIDDNTAFNKEYEKAIKKYSNYEGEKLKYNVCNYLYRKGFSKEQINSKFEEY